MELIEKAPAKINLSLDALYRHHDGEHEWRMVMTSVDLADYVHIQPSEAIRVTTDSGFLPEDPRNLAYKAATLLQQVSGVKNGASIHIEKHIPVSAGLGGGSSDAAAVLRGLNKLWQLGYSRAQLAQLGLKVDSDVPYCVYSQTAKVTGRGEIVEPLGALPNFLGGIGQAARFSVHAKHFKCSGLFQTFTAPGYGSSARRHSSP